MDIPIELICKIMSYIPKKKCNSCCVSVINTLSLYVILVYNLKFNI